MMQAAMQMQASMANMQNVARQQQPQNANASGSNDASTGANANANQPNANANQPNANPNQPNPFAAMFGGMGANNNNQQPNPFMANPFMMGMPGGLGGMNAFGAAPNANPAQNQQQQQNAAVVYRDQLSQLNSMGFNDPERNLQALISTGGNVQAAINQLLG